jgi:hypothetical protein
MWSCCSLPDSTLLESRIQISCFWGPDQMKGMNSKALWKNSPCWCLASPWPNNKRRNGGLSRGLVCSHHCAEKLVTGSPYQDTKHGCQGWPSLDCLCIDCWECRLALCSGHGLCSLPAVACFGIKELLAPMMASGLRVCEDSLSWSWGYPRMRIKKDNPVRTKESVTWP